MKKRKTKKKRKNNVLFLVIPMVILAVILSYIIITKNFIYEEYNDKFMTIDCYTEKLVGENIQYEVVNKVNPGDKIVCRISYELAYTVSKMSYDLEYSENLHIISSTDENENLLLSGNHYLYNYTDGTLKDKSPMITFQVKDNLVNNKLYINVSNIKFYTKAGKYYKGNNITYPIELDNDKKKIYLYQSDSGEYFYLSEKRDDYWNMFDIYECEDNKCVAMILDYDDNSYVISDEKLFLYKFNNSNEKKEIDMNKEFHILLPDGDEHIIRYYDILGKDIYTFENTKNKRRGIDIKNTNGFIANYEDIDSSSYNLSFTNETLKDGFILVDNKKDNSKSFIYDFINKKIVYEIKMSSSYYNYFNKTENGYSILMENPDDLQIVYLTSNFKNKFDHVITLDENYRKYANGNIIFMDNNKYFLYQKDGSFIKNIFEKIKPKYIYVKDNQAFAITWNYDNYFKIFDEDSNEIKKSNEYEKIFFVGKNIYVLKDNYFTIIDYDENILQKVTEITEEIMYIDNYNGGICFRNKSVPEGENGAYIVYYYDEVSQKLIKEELEYEFDLVN